MASISERQQHLYSLAVESHGDSPLTTHSGDPAIQHLRYERLLRGILPYLSGASILDVGCGFGDLGQFLADGEFGCTYSGIELVEGIAELGRKRCLVDIVAGDFLRHEYTEEVDFLVASGVFNTPGGVEREEWRVYCQAITKRMFSIAGKGIAFNGLTTLRDRQREDLRPWDPARALAFCQAELSPFCVLDHGYPLDEWTITVLRPDFVRETHPEPELEDYFPS